MEYTDRDKATDRMQSALAMCHHIQTRILQSAITGEWSDGVAHDVKQKCDAIADSFNLCK